MPIVATESWADAHSEPIDMSELLEGWMKRIECRDICRTTHCVELYWNHGSGIDVNLMADPYIHELMLRLVVAYPTLNIKKTDLRDGILRCHQNKPCLFHFGVAHKVADIVAERIKQVCGTYRFLKSNDSRYRPVSYTHLTLPTIYSV